MPYLTHTDYVQAREAYCYVDLDAHFNVLQTGSLPYTGRIQGIFPRVVPATHQAGINLRKFEVICETVFAEADSADALGYSTPDHLANIRNVVCAIVHWKMASQGGRGKVQNVQDRWTQSTHAQLLRAYRQRSLSAFRIDGIRIPTATAMLRFTYPNEFGIMDKRVVTRHTQPAGITTLSLRQVDSYINDTRDNVHKYHREYIPFLVAEATALNNAGVTFSDVDPGGRHVQVAFRPCDVEMALFL